MILARTLALVLVVALLLASVVWTVVARRGRWITDRECSSAHSLAMTFALWAIAVLLLDLSIR